MSIPSVLCLLTASFLFASCVRDVAYEGGGKTEEETADGGSASAKTEYNTGLEGLSAICLNEAGDGLLVAEDNGHVYEFGLDGQLRNTFSFPSPNDAHDWEGITRAGDGTIYLCEERRREVYRLGKNHQEVTLISKGPEVSGSKDNQGYEGIAAGPGVLYVCNQSDPLRVYSYSLEKDEWTTAFDADWAESLSDIYYDSTDGTLWITDAKTQALTQLKTDGTILKTYGISFVDKPEGFCRDTAHGTYWLVCDKKAKLYNASNL